VLSPCALSNLKRFEHRWHTRSLEISSSTFRRALCLALSAAAVGLFIASWTMPDGVTVRCWTKLGRELAIKPSVNGGRGLVGQVSREEVCPRLPESSSIARSSVLTGSVAPPNDVRTLSFGVQMTTFLEISVHSVTFQAVQAPTYGYARSFHSAVS
jgi:hypothetical protein